MEDKRSLDIVTGMWGGSGGRDGKRGRAWGSALEGQTLALEGDLSHCLKAPSAPTPIPKGKKNTHGITEICKVRVIKRPDLEWCFRQTMVTLRSSLSPIHQEGDIGRRY